MSRVNHVKLTCPEVQGLKDPFTGRDLVVYAHVCDGVVTYSAPDATSLRVPQLTVERLMKRASTRDGLVGAADEDERMKNPYDGEPLLLVTDDDGRYLLAGGFDPTLGCLDLSVFVKKASRGTRDFGRPPMATSVVDIPDLTPDDSDAVHKVVDEETEKAAHEIVKVIPGADKGRTTVGYRAPAKKAVKK